MEADIQKAANLLQASEEKLRKLTRCLIDDIIEEDSYRTAKEELLIEKTCLKQERPSAPQEPRKFLGGTCPQARQRPGDIGEDGICTTSS